MNAVIEIRVFGQVMNAFPFDGFVLAKTRSYRFQIFGISEELAMAIHARLRRGHASGRGRLDRLMAVTAIDTIVADVMLVTELNRLILFDVNACQIRRSGDLCVGKKRGAGEQGGGDHADPGDIVCTLVKELCHSRVVGALAKKSDLTVSQIAPISRES